MRAMKRGRLFTFRSGGWVLLLALSFTLAGTAWNLAPLWRAGRVKPRGDGRTAASYGFDLSTARVPSDAIVSSGMVVDGLPALVAPEAVPAAEIRTTGRGKFLVPSDKVIGLSLGGEARAYPLRMLVWHEVANDTLGGSPVAVTYNPVSEGIAVFDRRVGGETLTFGVSGLLYQSNLLLYDRRGAPGDESLWSQLQARAIAGPLAASGAVLEPVPFALCRFDAWIAAHPDSTVLVPIPGEEKRYANDVYASYLSSDALRYPVDPLPPEGTLPLKTRVFVSGPPGARRVRPLSVTTREHRFEVEGPGGASPVEGTFAFWFAWYATHLDDPGTIVDAP